MIERPNAKTF